MKHKKTLVSAVLFFAFYGGVQAQESPVVTGAEASGAGGTVSYSLGQVVYSSTTDAGGSLAEGVQQAFEIYTVAIEEVGSDIALAVYPNPTTDLLQLEVSDTERLSYELYDLQGRLLESRQLENTVTGIHTDALPAAVYMLKIRKDGAEVKTFKVVKNF